MYAWVLLHIPSEEPVESRNKYLEHRQQGKKIIPEKIEDQTKSKKNATGILR